MSTYDERDYAFGQAMLTLRTNIGLTQKRLAGHLGISRRAVGEWEAGSSYPKAEHLKEMIALGVKQQAFSVGHEAEEIRALWKAADQKVLIDERWLSALLDPNAAEEPHPLKVERELRGWSQAKVAEALSTTTRTVARWEQGQVTPYPYFREQLCELFGKDARQLGLLA